jgi:hypothetical protein
MRRCLSLAAVQIALLLSSCAMVEEEPELESSAALVLPSIVDWTPGRITPRNLFPDHVTHLHVLMTRGDRDRTFFAWGIGDGQVLWIVRVPLTYGGDLMDKMQDAFEIRETPGSNASHVIAGSVSAPPPRHPPLPGQPDFSTAYVTRVRDAANLQGDVTGDLLDDLAGL